MYIDELKKCHLSGLQICKYCTHFKACLKLALADVPFSYITCDLDELMVEEVK